MPLRDYLSILKQAITNDDDLFTNFLIHQWLIDDEIVTLKEKEEL